MSRHPVTPMDEADLGRHLARQTEKPIGLVDFVAMKRGQGDAQLARALAEGARIVSLSPGLIATPQGAREFEQRPDKHVLFAKTPLQREGTMVEIADAVEFLLSDRASFITGIDLLVDGGIAAAVQNEAEAAATGMAERVSAAPTGR